MTPLLHGLIQSDESFTHFTESVRPASGTTSDSQVVNTSLLWNKVFKI